MLEFIVLSDNHALDGFKSEHGLSLLIRRDEHVLLLDTGASAIFAETGAKLGVDFSGVQAIVLSHGHYDHTGGLADALALCPYASVYAGPGWSNTILNAGGDAIGVEAKPEYAAVTTVQGTLEIMPGVYVVQGIGEPVGPKDGKFKIIMDGRTVPDDFAHEVLVVVEQEDGLVLFSGCSHSGADNICEHVRHLFAGRDITAFVGGLHTYEKIIDGVDVYTGIRERCGRYFAAHTEIKRILTGHCTGEKGAEHLSVQIGDRVEVFRAGQTYSL